MKINPENIWSYRLGGASEQFTIFGKELWTFSSQKDACKLSLTGQARAVLETHTHTHAHKVKIPDVNTQMQYLLVFMCFCCPGVAGRKTKEAAQTAKPGTRTSPQTRQRMTFSC